MAHGEIHETVDVPFESLWNAIVRYEDYPDFVSGVSSVEIERIKPGHSRVTYALNLIKDIEYVLELKEELSADKKEGEVSWKLAESDFLKTNTGGWKLKDLGKGKTEVVYNVDVEFKFPVPGFILKKLVAGNLPKMLESFVERARE